jgi:hypothetical protein
MICAGDEGSLDCQYDLSAISTSNGWQVLVCNTHFSEALPRMCVVLKSVGWNP